MLILMTFDAKGNENLLYLVEGFGYLQFGNDKPKTKPGHYIFYHIYFMFECFLCALQNIFYVKTFYCL